MQSSCHDRVACDVVRTRRPRSHQPFLAIGYAIDSPHQRGAIAASRYQQAFRAQHRCVGRTGANCDASTHTQARHGIQCVHARAARVRASCVMRTGTTIYDATTPSGVTRSSRLATNPTTRQAYPARTFKSGADPLVREQGSPATYAWRRKGGGVQHAGTEGDAMRQLRYSGACRMQPSPLR